MFSSILNNSSSPRFLISSSNAVARFICVALVAKSLRPFSIKCFVSRENLQLRDIIHIVDTRRSSDFCCICLISVRISNQGSRSSSESGHTDSTRHQYLPQPEGTVSMHSSPKRNLWNPGHTPPFGVFPGKKSWRECVRNVGNTYYCHPIQFHLQTVMHQCLICPPVTDHGHQVHIPIKNKQNFFASADIPRSTVVIH